MPNRADLVRPLAVLPFQVLLAWAGIAATKACFDAAGYDLLVQGQVAIATAVAAVPSSVWQLGHQALERRRLRRRIRPGLTATIEDVQARRSVRPGLEVLVEELRALGDVEDRDTRTRVAPAIAALLVINRYESYELLPGNIDIEVIVQLRDRL